MASSAEALHLFDPDSVRDPIPHLTVGERIDVMQQAYGFIPDSSEEMVQGLSAVSLDNGPRGAAKHLGEVFGYQERREKGSGFRTARAITHEYTGYFRSAVIQRTHLEDLLEDLNVTNQHLDLREALPVGRVSASILANFIQKDTILELSRATSRTFAAEDLDENLTARRNKPEVAQAIAETLSGISVRDARDITKRAIANHGARRDFWRSRLEELRVFTPVRDLVQRALD